MKKPCKIFSPNHICESCSRVCDIFRLLLDFLDDSLLPVPNIHVASLWHVKPSQVEFLLLLTSATNLTYFFLERECSSGFEHFVRDFGELSFLPAFEILFFPHFSLLSERLQLILDTENFTDTYLPICRPLQVHTQMSHGYLHCTFRYLCHSPKCNIYFQLNSLKSASR